MRDAVTTITTPGETVGVVVTERGIAVTDRHADLKAELAAPQASRSRTSGSCSGRSRRSPARPRPLDFDDEVVALIEYRDGSIIDVVRKVKA